MVNDIIYCRLPVADCRSSPAPFSSFPIFLSNPNDMNEAMKWVSRPAYIGWALLGVWITTLRLRLQLWAEKNSNSGLA